MNPQLDRLHPYPFEKLRALLGSVTPVDLEPIALSIGEPQHPAPQLVLDCLQQHAALFAKYPTTLGLPELRQTIAAWLCRRFQLDQVDAQSQVLPVNGTREAIFSFIQASIDRRQADPVVIFPNPFYQIYEGAALLAGATPYYVPCTAESGYQPDFSQVPQSIWQRCQLMFICSPGNPTGAVMPLEQQQWLLQQAEQQQFILCSDECYSEIYPDEQQPPVGLLQACQSLGHTEFQQAVVFHSLSKRSNLPGLRSGFVAGDARYLKPYLRYRTYHGCTLPLPIQHASIAAWGDEQHVRANRDHYRRKFASVIEILSDVLPVQAPDASFYLWPQTPIDDERFAQALYEQQHITVLPGQYLSRSIQGYNPGTQHVRMALVADEQRCIEAAQRIKTFITQAKF